MVDGETGRVVALTGANSGIGYQILRELVRDGYRVAAFDVDGGNIQRPRSAQLEQVTFVECDVTRDESVERAVTAVIERWGRIDILVNNAGIATFALFETQSLNDIHREFDVNYFGYVRTIRSVLPRMRDRGTGIIHNMGSPAGRVGYPGMTGYASTKGAIEGLARSLRLELHDEDVWCTLWVPPATDTRMAAGLGYPKWLLADPVDVGRNFARQIESTDRVIMPDWQTRAGTWLIERFPLLWQWATDRFMARA